MLHSTCMEVRGQVVGVDFLLPLGVFWGPNPGCQAWLQVILVAGYLRSRVYFDAGDRSQSLTCIRYCTTELHSLYSMLLNFRVKVTVQFLSFLISISLRFCSLFIFLYFPWVSFAT